MSKIIADHERIPSVKITYTPTGEEYELDFSRASAVYAQNHGFNPDDVYTKPTVTIPQLFYYALRMHHQRIALNQAQALFDKLFPDGMPANVVTRLGELYSQASLVGIMVDEEEEGKNPQTAVEM